MNKQDSKNLDTLVFFATGVLTVVFIVMFFGCKTVQTKTPEQVEREAERAAARANIR